MKSIIKVVLFVLVKIYEPIGNITEADCLIGLSFGTSIKSCSVNANLAHQMLDYSDGRPMIADRTLVEAMPDGESLVAHVVEGPVTNIRAQGVGTWGTLVEAHQFMVESGLSKPIMIAQAYHVSRVVRQAAKLGISSIVPEGLPKEFDKNSAQPWTRSALLYLPINALGSLRLKMRGQL